MEFVDLGRLFVPLKRDADATLEWGPHWGRKYGGWLDWQSVLGHWRVVLLAEALSGKTKELEHRAEVLKRDGKPAFFLRIEDLADDRFEASLNDEDKAAFHSWVAVAAGEAWFFLDSVDEARLNGKKLVTALQTFRTAVSGNLNRAHVIVSCRVSDWRGKADRESLQKELPYVPPAKHDATVTNPDEILLSPVFDTATRTARSKEPQTGANTGELLVVQLSSLTYEQQERMAIAASISNVPEFLQAVRRSGLEAMSERPGDLIDLIGYWLDHGGFGSLQQMTEEGVKRKLHEEDAYRPDAGILSRNRARRGAERLAAALVLGKTFTIKAPGQDPDPTLAKGALDPRDVLSDWDQEAINALLRTGIFAPGTYGRVRFHHRSTQEYLAACWLRWLTEKNCPITELHRLLFVEPYGVPTVVPTLRAVAAWLSLWLVPVREQVIRREPVSLIVHGDPKSLPLEVREKLLEAYAALDAKGDLNVEMIDFRAAWMFSSPALSAAVRRAWGVNARAEFRMHLLEFIEEGCIKECADLARDTALDPSANQWHRLAAARALLACKDIRGLRALTSAVRAAPDRLSARLAPQMASLLYPAYLSTDDLLSLIERSEPAEPYQVEGFSYQLASLHALAPSRAAQRQFSLGIATLVMKAPYADEDLRVSSRHVELCKGLASLAKAELDRRAPGDVEDGLVRLLMAVERASGMHAEEDEREGLAKRVRQDKALNRQLIWADAQTDREGKPKETLPIRIWQVGPHTGHILWRTDMSDLEWLVEDSRRMGEEYERRIAFSAILSALHFADLAESRRELLDQLAAGDPVLQADLDEYRKPAPVDPYAADAQARKERANKKTQKAKQSWIDFRDLLESTPGILDAPDAVNSWKSGRHRLYDLTNWIDMKARHDGIEGPAKWQALTLGFGPVVAKHYAHAMSLTWRSVHPERPKKTGDNRFSSKRENALAVSAVEFDSLKPGWEHSLSDAEVALAVQHACFAGTIRADWMDRLVLARPSAALPVIISAVSTEYRSNGTYSDVIVSAAHRDTPALSTIAMEILRLLRRSEPVDDVTLERSIRIVRRGLAGPAAMQARTLVSRRLDLHLASANEKRAFEYFGALASIDPEELAKVALLKLARGVSEPEADYEERVPRWLGELFAGQGDHGVATDALPKVPILYLAQLLRLAYEHIAAVDWTARRSSLRRSSSEKAQSARGTLFNVLAERPGAEAYDALLALSADPVFADSSLRLREIAHARAEADGDLPAWLATEVTKFEHTHSTPIKTGAQLLMLTQGILADIQASFTTADASSRQLLARAEHEEEVQEWLAERLNERARSRYSAARESEVAERNEPDIVISSTSADVQIAVEVKNANKKWTVTQLESAIRGQLARDYLRPANRRYGILVVSLHRNRTWRVAEETWDFARLIAHLQQIAQAIRANTSGPVQVLVFGLDARIDTQSSTRKHSGKQRPAT
ncbi:hypothetical protein [Variovorax sp. W2I14]|uniref:hypothetical protein n=1 Tax=Variovorax sp. W2I14 TaxID=3042290 RepID=UPI003D1FCB66